MKSVAKGVNVDPHISAWLQAVKARTGLSEAEQIRRGIEMWLQEYGWSLGPSPSSDAAQTKKR
jgi:hypothetical protein